MTNQNILLKFTAKNDFRFHLEHICKNGNYLYATDGAICVRMADDGSEPTPLQGDVHTEKLSKYIDDWLEKESENQNLSPLVFDVPRRVECLNCDEDGLIHEGDRCYTCGDCDGSKLVYPERAQSLCGKNFQTKYIAKLSKLPNIKFGLSQNCGRDGMAYFTFDGGQGVLMHTGRTAYC